MRFPDQTEARQQWYTSGSGFAHTGIRLVPICLVLCFSRSALFKPREDDGVIPWLMSAFFTPQISNAIQAKNDCSSQWRFWSMQYSFIVCAFVGVFGGAFFLLTSLYIEEDRKEAEQLWGFYTSVTFKPVSDCFPICTLAMIISSVKLKHKCLHYVNATLVSIKNKGKISVKSQIKQTFHIEQNRLQNTQGPGECSEWHLQKASVYEGRKIALLECSITDFMERVVLFLLWSSRAQQNQS